MNKVHFDPIGKLMGLRHKSHPWHGVDIGENAPEEVVTFVEMVPTDTVKYEVDKPTGYLILDRPQKYSSILPALYGFLPRTYCGKRIGDISAKILKRPEIVGDGDPLDICVLTEKDIASGDILVRSIPIGGFRMIDGNQADDKIVAVLKNDAFYGDVNDISQLPDAVVDRLKHYFLTYKDMPGSKELETEVTHVYGREEAISIILDSLKDYKDYVNKLLFD